MYKIVFIIIYIGDYLWYFPYFLHSCQYNPNIDFLIYTDNHTKLELPPNVKIIPYSIEQFKTDASKILGFDISVESGYKLWTSNRLTVLSFQIILEIMISGAIAMWM